MAKNKNGSMKLSELVGSEVALVELSVQKMKAKASFRIAKVINQVRPHLETFRKIQQELLEKHGKKNGEGYIIEPDMKGWKTYINEIEDMLVEDVEVSIKKIPLNLLTNAEISAQEIATLDWLIEE
jgi:hypothetical protein